MTLAAVFAEAAADTSGIKTALIAAIAVVIAAAIPALLSLREREPKEIKRLREATDKHAEDMRDAEVRESVLEERVRTLERFLWTIGIDPITFAPIVHPPVSLQHENRHP